MNQTPTCCLLRVQLSHFHPWNHSENSCALPLGSKTGWLHTGISREGEGKWILFFPKMRRIENSWVDTRASWFNLTHTWLFENGWSDCECVRRVLSYSFYTFSLLFASCLKQLSSGWSVKMPLCFSISSALCIWTDVYMRHPPQRAERIRGYKVRFPWRREREDDEYPPLPPLKCQTCPSSLTSELFRSRSLTSLGI